MITRRLTAALAVGGALAVSIIAAGSSPAAAVGQRSAGCVALNAQTLSAPVINVNAHAFKQYERVDLQASGPSGDGVSVSVNGAVVASSSSLPASFSYYIPSDGTYSFHLADTLGQVTTWHSNCYPGPYPTLSVLHADVSTPVAGQPITFVSTVTGPVPGAPPTGSVSFYVDGSTTPAAVVALVAQQASFTYAFATTGDHTVNAVYSGDTYNLSSSDTSFVTVDEAATSTTFTATPAVQAPSSPVVLSGAVAAAAPGAGTPTGHVTILNRGTPIATAVLTNGTYTASVSTAVLGTYTLHAVYTGDANYAPSLSPSRSITINGQA